MSTPKKLLSIFLSLLIVNSFTVITPKNNLITANAEVTNLITNGDFSDGLNGYNTKYEEGKTGDTTVVTAVPEADNSWVKLNTVPMAKIPVRLSSENSGAGKSMLHYEIKNLSAGNYRLTFDADLGVYTSASSYNWFVGVYASNSNWSYNRFYSKASATTSLGKATAVDRETGNTLEEVTRASGKYYDQIAAPKTDPIYATFTVDFTIADDNTTVFFEFGNDTSNKTGNPGYIDNLFLVKKNVITFNNDVVTDSITPIYGVQGDVVTSANAADVADDVFLGWADVNGNLIEKYNNFENGDFSDGLEGYMCYDSTQTDGSADWSDVTVVDAESVENIKLTGKVAHLPGRTKGDTNDVSTTTVNEAKQCGHSNLLKEMVLPSGSYTLTFDADFVSGSADDAWGFGVYTGYKSTYQRCSQNNVVTDSVMTIADRNIENQKNYDLDYDTTYGTAKFEISKDSGVKNTTGTVTFNLSEETTVYFALENNGKQTTEGAESQAYVNNIKLVRTDAFESVMPATDTTYYAMYKDAYIVGDVDGSKAVNVSDLIRLKKVCAGSEVSCNTLNANIAKDGIIDSIDLTALCKILLQSIA